MKLTFVTRIRVRHVVLLGVSLASLLSVTTDGASGFRVGIQPDGPAARARRKAPRVGVSCASCATPIFTLGCSG